MERRGELALCMFRFATLTITRFHQLDMDELNSLPSLFSSILSTSNSVQKTSASSLSTDLPAEKYEGNHNKVNRL